MRGVHSFTISFVFHFCLVDLKNLLLLKSSDLVKGKI